MIKLVKPKNPEAKTVMAYQFDCKDNKENWPTGVRTNLDGDGYYLSESTHPWNPKIKHADWVIYDDGKRFVCPSDLFTGTYEIIAE